MKQANSTEIDRLLRRHARRADAARGEGGGGLGDGARQTGTHLDADEMSAFAEGALPAAARARYVAHLADCDACRKIVTDLVMASDVGVKEDAPLEEREVTPSKPWWSAIAALFTPPVIRFAVPALLLLGVIVVAFVATRDRGESQFVARNEQKQAGGAVSKEEEAHAPSVQGTPGVLANANTLMGNMNANQASVPTPEPSSSDGQLAKNIEAPKPPPAPVTGTTTTPSGSPNDSTSTGEKPDDQLYSKEPDNVPAPAAQQPPPPTAASKTAERAAEEKEARKQNEVAPVSRTESADLARNKDEDRSNPSVAGGSATGQAAASPQAGTRVAASRRGRETRSDSAGADNKDKAGESTETRSVGGSRFRRQGNAWVDTAYHSSRSTISVARGSDQYRALVADEPSLRTIADQLDGEVIVVWKGKAYRIY
jgi:hypothetical protein